MMRTPHWNLWSEKCSPSLFLSLLTFFSSPVFWFSSNDHILHHSYAYLFLSLPFSLLSHMLFVPLSASPFLHPFLTLVFSRGPFILYLHPWSLHKLYAFALLLSIFTISKTSTHAAVWVNETLMGNRLCLFCSQSLILALQSKAHVRSHTSKAQSSELPEHCVMIKKPVRRIIYVFWTFLSEEVIRDALSC